VKAESYGIVLDEAEAERISHLLAFVQAASTTDDRHEAAWLRGRLDVAVEVVKGERMAAQRKKRRAYEQAKVDRLSA
jgi:hypothetical protein